MEPSSSEQFQNSQHCEELLQQLSSLRKDEQLCDVVLISGAVRISAHKNVLAAASPYFRAMFSGHFPERTQREIHLEQLDTQCLQVLVEHMYSGSLQLSVTIAQRLLMTADFLQLDWAADCCATYLMQRLAPDNCLGLQQFAELHVCHTLQQAARDYAVKHFVQVMRCAEFLELSNDELRWFLSSDALYVHAEDVLLAGIARWLQHQPQTRLSHAASLISQLHPACISAVGVRALDKVRFDESADQWLHSVRSCASQRAWHIYVLDKMGRTADLQRFDLAAGVLTPLQPLPSAAFAVSMVAHYSNNRLYVQGGCTGRSRVNSYCYHLYRDQWHCLPPLLEARSHHRTLLLEERLYALGGSNKNVASNTVECLDLTTNASMYVGNMLAQRSSMGAVALDTSLYVMGGETDHRSLHTMEQYDTREGVWHELASLSVVNSYCTSASINSQQIYCCEGLGSCMERYDVRAAKWELIDFCDEREFYEIFSVGSDLYSVSGEEISRYFVAENQWRSVYEFPFAREWDTAVGMQMLPINV